MTTQQPTPPPPAPLTELKLIDEIKTAVNNALATGHPMLLAYVDEDGQPSLSFRGSTQTYGDDSLGLWVRNPEGGLLHALAHNNRLTMFYRDAETRTTLQFRGLAHIDESEAVRDEVYNSAPEQERNADRERKGSAMIIKLHRIDGTMPGMRIQMKA